jgi:hypothetical protein
MDGEDHCHVAAFLFYSHPAILAYVNQFNNLFASEVITLLTLLAFLSKEKLRRMNENKDR